jgi:hypothetical protein
LDEKFYNSLKIAQYFFLQHLKSKIIFHLVTIMAPKKDIATDFFSPPSSAAVFGSGIRNRDPGFRMKSKFRDSDFCCSTFLLPQKSPH